MKQIIKELDDVVRKIVRLRDKKCQRCNRLRGYNGKIKKVDCSHFYGRWYHSVRWNLDNLVLLCTFCHMNYFHSHPLEFTEFMKDRLGETRFDLLQIVRHEVKKVDKQLMLIGLRQLLKEYEDNENIKVYAIQ